MKVIANGTTYDVELPTDGMKLTYKEGVAVEKALGIPFPELEKKPNLQLVGAIVWTLVKRQDPTVRIDAIDFDLDQYFAEGKEEEKPEDEPAVPPVDATGSNVVASDT